MKKTLLTGVAALSVLSASAAHAGQRPHVVVGKPRIIITTIPGSLMPPPKYDKPYDGELEIRLFANAADVQEICKKLGSDTGCAHISVDHKRCQLYVASEDLAKRLGRNYAFLLRHELAHCNGWYHPPTTEGRKFNIGDTWDKAEGGKWLAANAKMAMPKLPASTRILPAAPPVVCVTPDWKQEPCAKRQEGAWAYSRPFPSASAEPACPKPGEVYVIAKVPPQCLVR